MISASHNPPEYNGIKIFDHNGQKITENFEIKIQKIIEDLKQNISIPKKVVSLKTSKDLMDSYIKSLIQTMGGESLSGLRIILDTCYGSATTCARKIFQSLGADVRAVSYTHLTLPTTPYV